MARTRLQILIIFFCTSLGCVDPADLSLPEQDVALIVEGHIKDYSGPDTVRLSRSYPADGKTYPPVGVPGAKLWITDDTGLVDTLIDMKNGIYVTNALQGAVGRTYRLDGKIAVKRTDGAVETSRITSTLEQMLPAGTLDSIYYEMTTKVDQETGTQEYGLNIFIDATVDPTSSHRLRWKVNGTYIFLSDPAALLIPVACLDPVCPSFPPACAANCECCLCWVSEREDLPLVTNPAFLVGTVVKRVFVKYIPINGFTFYEKYRVEVAQMELSEPVFDFYSGIRKQMVNASSLFQPPFFELSGNVTAVSGKTKIIGVFSAAAEVKSSTYIIAAELPIDVAGSVLPGDCRAMVDNATNIKPPFWN